MQVALFQGLVVRSCLVGAAWSGEGSDFREAAVLSEVLVSSVLEMEKSRCKETK